MFERLDNRAIISYEIITKSDLHIGGHISIKPEEVDNPFIKDMDGFPVIPGSSLKGVLRTEMERLLRGLKLPNISVCDVLGVDHGGCNACPVCYLFGGSDLASSIRVKDATTEQKKTMIRDGVAIDRKKRKAKGTAKYDIEVVPRGTVFNGKFTIENTDLDTHTHAKLGALLSLIDFFNSCDGSIGHASSRGFGEIQLKFKSINLITSKNYIEGNYKGTQYDLDTPDYNTLKKCAIGSWSKYILSGKNE